MLLLSPEVMAVIPVVVETDGSQVQNSFYPSIADAQNIEQTLMSDTV